MTKSTLGFLHFWKIACRGLSWEVTQTGQRWSQGSHKGLSLAHYYFSYINDLPENLNLTVRLFADDCVVYRNITFIQDTQLLQQDLEHFHRGRVVGRWASTQVNVMFFAFLVPNPQLSPITTGRPSITGYNISHLLGSRNSTRLKMELTHK